MTSISNDNVERNASPDRITERVQIQQFFSFKRYMIVSCLSALMITTDYAQVMPAATTTATATQTSTSKAPTPSPAAQNGSSVIPSSAVQQLAPVIVKGDLDAAREQIAPSLGAVTYKIGQNQIQSQGQGDNSSFQQVLLHAPGVVQDQSGEIHVRGDHGNLQYRINGVLLPESLNGFGQEVEPHLINSVTLITGTLPAQFGDRTAGIIDITTKEGSQLNGNEASIYGGSYDTIHPSASFGGTTKNLDYFVTTSYLHNDLGISNTTPGDPLHDTTNQESLFGYFSQHLDESSRATLLLSADYSDFEIPNIGGVSPNYINSDNSTLANSAAQNDNQNEQNYYAVLSYQKSEGDFSGQVSAFSRFTDIRFTPDPVQDLLFNGNAAKVANSDFANGLQADASYKLGDHHTVRFGLLVNYDIETLDTTSTLFPASSQFAPPTPGQELPSPTPQSSSVPETIVANGGNRGVTSGIYVQDEWKLSDQLTLNYGLRYDRFDVSFDHKDRLNPRINVVWQIDDFTTAHVGYARYFLPPTLQYVPPSTLRKFEYTTDAPFNGQDSAPKVETNHYFDAGISRQITDPWQITLDSFCKFSKDLADDGQFGTAVILNNFNYTSGTVYGAEASTTYKQGPFSAYGNFSYVQTWVQNIDSVQNEFPNNELDYLSSHHFQLDHQGVLTGSGGVSYAYDKDTLLHTDFLYDNGLRGGFANSEKLAPYETVNIGVEHTWHLNGAGINDLKLRFDCLNVLDKDYELRDGSGIGIAAAPAFGPRRAFYGGLTVTF